MRTALILVISLILLGCTTMEQANGRISAWQNSSLDNLVQAWGLPTKEQTIGSRKFYVWTSHDASNSPAIGISLGTGGRHGGISLATLFGGGHEEDYCSRVVEVDKQEAIIGIQWNGDPSLCYKATPELITTTN